MRQISHKISNPRNVVLMRRFGWPAFLAVLVLIPAGHLCEAQRLVKKNYSVANVMPPVNFNPDQPWVRGLNRPLEPVPNISQTPIRSPLNPFYTPEQAKMPNEPFSGPEDQGPLKKDRRYRNYHGFIKAAAKRHRIAPALIKAIIMAESGYNTRAVSKMGAAGLMQLMPATAKVMGVRDRFNPAQNIDAGAAYFRYLLDRFNGEIKLALAAYNAGPSAVVRYKGIPPFKTTLRYVKKVLRYYRQFYRAQSLAGRAQLRVDLSS